MVESNFDPARTASGKFIASAQAVAGSLEERGARGCVGATDVGAKAIGYVGKNVQPSLDYAQSLLRAKDMTEIMQLHANMFSPKCGRWRNSLAKRERS
jgi:hypothetical protein